jgi:hypothetical protein
MLIATFVFGFVSGVILYLYNNASGGNGEVVLDDATISITAYRYGGCERAGGCPLYRITNDGTYTYMMRGAANEEARFENILNDTEQTELFKILKDTNLSKVTDTVYTGTCPVEHDGIAYRYTIVYNENRYRFDTCKQSLDNVPLFEVLQRYFDMFATTYTIP